MIFRCILLCLMMLAAQAALGADRPNVLLIVADDMGYSDAGCYGGEISTPHLDALAANGLRFTQFYNTGRCWPTRASLLTGYYPQQVRRDALPQLPGGAQAVRPAWAKLLPELLPEDYRSYHSGKWHIDGGRLKGGFARSYSLEDHDRNFGPKRHLLDDKPLPAVTADEKYFTSTAIADHAIECLSDHAKAHRDRPFFHYLCFTSPHFPLQAPQEAIAKTLARYSAGWEALREQRAQRLAALGIFEHAVHPFEQQIGPPYPFPAALEKLGPAEVNRPLPWSQLNDEQQKFQVAKMAIHAAMVEIMDREIGRVIEQLRADGMLENTIVFFLSDNGASAEIMVRGDGHDRSAPLGSAETFLCLGPGWSTASNTPFRRHKTWVHEGGIATPLIVHWPAGITAKGEFRRAPAHVIDIVPTVLDLAGVSHEKSETTPAMPGVSLKPLLKEDRPLSRAPLWWLHEGNRALRDGDWKLVADKGAPWELYDLSEDRGETQNLAEKAAEKVAELAARWQAMTDQFAKDAVGKE